MTEFLPFAVSGLRESINRRALDQLPGDGSVDPFICNDCAQLCGGCIPLIADACEQCAAECERVGMTECAEACRQMASA